MNTNSLRAHGALLILGMLASAWLVAQEGEALPAPTAAPAALGLPDLIQLTLDRNPRLAQAGFAIDVARGHAAQAGLYPNPVLSVTGDELGDRTGPPGIWSAPFVSQEIVTGQKLRLSRSAADREVDQATLALVAERYHRFTAVRQSYFEVLTLQRRIGILRELSKLAEESAERTKKLLAAKEAARLDLVQLEIEVERYRAELEATERELPAAFRRLAASVGVQALPYTQISGSLETPAPDYYLERARAFVVEAHPDIQSAGLGVERARLLVQRAQKEPIPNVTVGAGYQRQSQNRSNDWAIGVSVPVPLWNRNQGNIAAAQALLAQAIEQIGRVENDLVGGLAEAYQEFASARQRAERYRIAILPRARETYQLSLQAYKGGQFEYLRVLEAQRAVAQANLEYNRALGELWRAASAIAGLLLEEDWPTRALPQAPEPIQPKE